MSQNSSLSRKIKLLENKYFETIEIDTLNKFVSANNSNFYLFYSKPIDNYLIAELLLITLKNGMFNK